MSGRGDLIYCVCNGKRCHDFVGPRLGGCRGVFRADDVRRPLHGQVREGVRRLLLRRKEGAVVDGRDKLLHGYDQLVRVHRAWRSSVHGRDRRDSSVLELRVCRPCRDMGVRGPLAPRQRRHADGIPGAPLRRVGAAVHQLVRSRVQDSRQHGPAVHAGAHGERPYGRFGGDGPLDRMRRRPRIHSCGRTLERACDGHDTVHHTSRSIDSRPSHVHRRGRRAGGAAGPASGALQPLQRPQGGIPVPRGILSDGGGLRACRPPGTPGR